MNDEPTPEQLQQIDDILLKAGCYIRPRDELRARILEGVQDGIDRKHRWRRWLCSISAASGVMAVALIVVSLSVSLIPRGRTADDLMLQANHKAFATQQTKTIGTSETNAVVNWALTEVFADWRRGTTAGIRSAVNDR